MIQHVGDCGYFKWADNELSTYERKMMQRLNDIEEHSRAEAIRLEQLMDTKIAKFRENQCRAVISLIILLVLLYVTSGYNGCSNHKYMLK
jgi:cytochrome c oxidase assembly factor CtaG